MSLKSRMERFGLREDRADVILPACFVYHRIAELNGSEEILVPRVSLKDGVIQEILERAKGAEHLLDLREQVGVSCRGMVARYKRPEAYGEGHRSRPQPVRPDGSAPRPREAGTDLP